MLTFDLIKEAAARIETAAAKVGRAGDSLDGPGIAQVIQ